MVDLLRVHLSRTVGELREDFWGRRQHWVARAPRPECPLSPCAPVQRGRAGAGAARPSGKPWALEPQIMRSDAKSQKIASSFSGITWFLSPTTPARGNASSRKIMPHLEITQGKTPLPSQRPKKKISETLSKCFSKRCSSPVFYLRFWQRSPSGKQSLPLPLSVCLPQSSGKRGS